MKTYKRGSVLILILLVVITTFAFLRIPKLGFNYEFESYFPINDPDLTFYQKFRKVFSSDNDFLLLGIENEEGIFKQDFLEQVANLTQDLKEIERVERVTSPTDLKNPVIGLFGIIQVPYIHVNEPDKYPKDSIRIYKSEQLVGNFFAENGKAISLIINTEQELSKAKSDQLLDDIEAITSKYQFDNLRVAGRIKGQRYFIEKMQVEMVKFVCVSVLLLVIFLLFAFRSFWGVWVPITVVLATATWLLAFMQLTGKYIDVVTTLVPTILFVVGMSDVVHIISKYLEELRSGKEKMAALKITFKEIGIATFLTSLTTAVGFLTLLTANVQPIRDFGQYTAVGVFMAFILAFSLLPAVLVLIKKPKLSKKAHQDVFWNRKLSTLFIWTMRKAKPLLVGFVLLMGLSLVLLTNIKVNNYLLEDLQKGDDFRNDFEFFEEHFSAVRPFELAISIADGKNVFDLDVLRKIDETENYLKETYGVRTMISPATFIKKIVQAMNGGVEKNFRLPKDEVEHQKALKYLDRINPKQQQLFVTKSGTLARISGRMTDYGGYIIKQKNEAFDEFMHQNTGEKITSYRLTGTSLLIDKNNEYLAGNLMEGLLIAFGVIALLVGILYRSFLMVILSLIPNIFPLLMIAGFMGATGIDLKVSTSIIFTIAFGVAVDDTIHFLSKLRIELSKGKSLLYAMKRTYMSAGKAIVITTLILCSGFCTLVFSSFNSIYYIGLLISIALFFAVVADLLLLPALLKVFYQPKK